MLHNSGRVVTAPDGTIEFSSGKQNIADYFDNGDTAVLDELCSVPRRLGHEPQRPSEGCDSPPSPHLVGAVSAEQLRNQLRESAARQLYVPSLVKFLAQHLCGLRAWGGEEFADRLERYAPLKAGS